MKRLVYSPYVQAFVNTDDGVIDVSPYLVRGSINRKINQVSSAQLTLRNPVQGASSRLLFTEYTSHGREPHPVFHPMDPIIIIMQRLAGHPVQVFTGYLDTSPYLQLYPGLCSLQASCTLKRLLYTQWDASLPAVQNFLEQFGWEPNGSGIWNPSADSQQITGNAGKIQGQFTDGSIGALLFAIVNIIGNWDESTIWIEALPPQIKDIVLNLYQTMAPLVATAEGTFESLLTQILGTTSQGSGAPGAPASGTAADGSITGPITIKGSPPNSTQLALITQVMNIATGLNAPKLAIEALLEACIQENDFTNNPGGGGGSNGLLQLIPSTAAQAGVSPLDVNGCVTAFLTNGYNPSGGEGAIAYANANPSAPADQVAQFIQGSGAGASYYAQWLNEADKIINAYSTSATAAGSQSHPGHQPRGPSSASTAPADTVSTAIASTATQVAGTSPGGVTGTPGGASAGDTGSLAQVAVVARAALARQQSSHCFHYQQLRPINYNLTTGTVYIDCSGFAIACYKAAGLQDPSHNNFNGSGFTGDMINHTSSVGASAALPGDLCFFGSDASNTEHVNVYVGGGQSISMGSEGEPAIGPSASMGPSGFLGFFRSDVSGSPAAGGVPAAAAGAGGGGASGGTGDPSMAAAFATMINLPSTFNQADAELFTGKRSFIADQPLFPFVDQVAKASMRSYMSMPNGNFFAFFPDYFGFFGRKYYWEIRDMEIIDGRIDLSDDPLLTHMAVAGDVQTYPSGTVTFSDLVLTAGIFDIFDAFATGYIGQASASATQSNVKGKDRRDPQSTVTGKDPRVAEAAGGSQEHRYGMINTNPVASTNTMEAAVNFLQRYGARPYVEEVPAIRSPFYELFLAFQNFMLAWSKQYETTFELTFMPEIFPGGLIALPDHHIQCYVEEVVHNFDYEQGFTTTVNLSSPSQLPNDPLSRSNVTAGMARPAALTSLQAKNSTDSKLKGR